MMTLGKRSGARCIARSRPDTDIAESLHRSKKSKLVQSTYATQDACVEMSKGAHLVPQKDPIRIALVVYPNVDSLDVAGPAQVFAFLGGLPTVGILASGR